MKRVPVGLLGADYKIENGRYRFSRIYNGENWNPQTHLEGLVGFFGPFEALMDGGVVTAPSRGFWTLNNNGKSKIRALPQK